jgi:hypothetical protein
MNAFPTGGAPFCCCFARRTGMLLSRIDLPSLTD